ncbi:MAG: hypothetical protein IT355_05940 [Gemmatimonadaceae bacterium]|nr:hypothetical protein [Gemmatimonadaceae bacterium]
MDVSCELATLFGVDLRVFGSVRRNQFLLPLAIVVPIALRAQVGCADVNTRPKAVPAGLASRVNAVAGFETVLVASTQAVRTSWALPTGRTIVRYSLLDRGSASTSIGIGSGTGCTATTLAQLFGSTSVAGHTAQLNFSAGQAVLSGTGLVPQTYGGLFPTNLTFYAFGPAGTDVVRDAGNPGGRVAILAFVSPADSNSWLLAGIGSQDFLVKMDFAAATATALAAYGPAQLISERRTLRDTVKATLLDAGNNVVPLAGTAVTVSLASGSGSLGGTLTATTGSDGVARFPDIVITGNGAHTLKFTAAGLTDATLPMQVLPLAHLEVTALPTSAYRGLSFTPRISLRVADASGSTVPLNLVDAQVRVASGPGALAPTSATTARFSAGVAQFSNTAITADGLHRLRFTVPFLDSIVSADINVVAPPVITSGPALPAATRGQLYDIVLRTSVDSAGVTWVVISGAVPSGLALAPNGRLSGTPDSSGTSAFMVRAISSAFAPLASVTANLTLTVSATAGSTGPRLVVRGAPGAIRRVAADSLLCASADTTATTCTLSTSTAVTVVAKGTPTSGFTGWQQLCTGRAACAIPAGTVQELHAVMVPLPAITTTAAEQDLLTGTGLTNPERSLLDQTGNGNGLYDIGDLMAHLERNGQSLSARVQDAINASDVPLVRTFRAPATTRQRGGRP